MIPFSVVETGLGGRRKISVEKSTIEYMGQFKTMVVEPHGVKVEDAMYDRNEGAFVDVNFGNWPYIVEQLAAEGVLK